MDVSDVTYARQGGTQGGTQVYRLCNTPLSQASARAPGRQGTHTRLPPSSGGGSTPVGDMPKGFVSYERHELAITSAPRFSDSVDLNVFCSN